METFLDQLQQLNTNLAKISPLITITAAAILGVLAKFVLSLRRALDFHDEYFVKKRIKRITEIKALINEGPLTQFLDKSLEIEAFRIDTGIKASPAQMKALIEIHDSGLWTVPQLRGAARHLVVDRSSFKAAVKITRTDRVVAIASIFFALILLMAGAAYFAALAFTRSLSAFVAGAMLFSFFLMIGHLISYDYRAYRIATQVKLYLERHTSN